LSKAFVAVFVRRFSDEPQTYRRDYLRVIERIRAARTSILLVVISSWFSGRVDEDF
jgi:uncharacterized protein (DUF849 family)